MSEPSIKPPEVILVNKNIFVSCLRALGVFLENASDNYNTIRQSPYMSNESKTALMTLLKEDMIAIGNITNALEVSMDFKIQPDDAKGYIN